MPMVGGSQFPHLDREDYTLWAMNMEVAMEGAKYWEAVDPGGAEYAKGAAKYRKDCQALTAIYSAMPKDVLQHLLERTRRRRHGRPSRSCTRVMTVSRKHTFSP